MSAHMARVPAARRDAQPRGSDAAAHSAAAAAASESCAASAAGSAASAVAAWPVASAAPSPNASLAAELTAVQQRITGVEDKINAVEAEIAAAEKVRDGYPLGSEQRKEHTAKLERLGRKEEQLRVKEEQLRDELKRKELALERAVPARRVGSAVDGLPVSGGAAASASVVQIAVSPAVLLAQLQRDMPCASSATTDIPLLSASNSSEHSAAGASSEDVAAVDVCRRAGRRSLTRHASALPRGGISAADFGSYLKFVNRVDECSALVTHLQESYLAFRHRAATPVTERGGGGDYLKALQVVYSAGAPGIGKTTWARMALDYAPHGCASDARFSAVLEQCTQRGWRYRICFGEDMLAADELAAPALSLAARLLWQHVKYELPHQSDVRSYDIFWRYLRDRSLVLSASDVLDHICGAVPACERMVLVNLDEINVLFPDSVTGAAVGPPIPQADYLQRLLRHMLQLQIDGLGFVMPVLTATKALRVREIIRLSGCALREIPLPLLAPPCVEELVLDLLSRAQQASRTAPARGSVAAASAALAALQLEEPTSMALPPLLCNLLELMAGHPRFLEKLLFRLGRPDGAAQEWVASTFVEHMRELQSPAPPASAVLESWLGAVAEDILTRYAAFKQYIVRPEFVAIAPQLLGYTLFHWSVNREREFCEGQYRCSVQQLEEDGVVFLTPKPAPFSAAAGGSRRLLRSSPPDVELRLVMPFLWLHVLYVRHADSYASSVVQLSLVKTLTCQLSPAQNEELTLSVLALKCFCLAQRGKPSGQRRGRRGEGDVYVSSHELLGFRPSPATDLQLRLPPLSSTLWAPVKLDHQITSHNWERWYAEQRGTVADAASASDSSRSRSGSRGTRPQPAAAAAASSAPRHHFYLNGAAAPFWDSCALTDPPIFVQDKQSLGARGRAAQGAPPLAAHSHTWAAVQAEVHKCEVGGVSPLFLFCCEGAVTGARPAELSDRVVIVDRAAHDAFFGPVLASRRAMCLSEIGAAAKTR